jgi:excisionase family DNA binding protein
VSDPGLDAACGRVDARGNNGFDPGAENEAVNPGDVLIQALATVYLAVSPKTIYNMVEARQLSSVRHGKRIMLDIQDLDAWIRANKRNAG